MAYGKVPPKQPTRKPVKRNDELAELLAELPLQMQKKIKDDALRVRNARLQELKLKERVNAEKNIQTKINLARTALLEALAISREYNIGLRFKNPIPDYTVDDNDIWSASTTDDWDSSEH